MDFNEKWSANLAVKKRPEWRFRETICWLLNHITTQLKIIRFYNIGVNLITNFRKLLRKVLQSFWHEQFHGYYPHLLFYSLRNLSTSCVCRNKTTIFQHPNYRNPLGQPCINHNQSSSSQIRWCQSIHLIPWTVAEKSSLGMPFRRNIISFLSYLFGCHGRAQPLLCLPSTKPPQIKLIKIKARSFSVTRTSL